MRINKVIKETWEQHPDWQEKFWQFMRFGIVGTISSAIHYGVYCLVLLAANPTLSFTAGYAVDLFDGEPRTLRQLFHADGLAFAE
mgnify:CR=1 FL=1